jgi:hypothetical protein
METDKSSYYLHKGLPLFFALIFLGISIIGLLFPGDLTVTHNDEVVETNLQNLIPFIVIGVIALFLFIWLSKNYFRVYMDDAGITIKRLNEDNMLSWDELEYVKGVNWLWNGAIFKAKPKQNKPFYFLADKPEISFKNIFSQGFKNKMGAFIKEKNVALKK